MSRHRLRVVNTRPPPTSTSDGRQLSRNTDAQPSTAEGCAGLVEVGGVQCVTTVQLSRVRSCLTGLTSHTARRFVQLQRTPTRFRPSLWQGWPSFLPEHPLSCSIKLNQTRRRFNPDKTGRTARALGRESPQAVILITKENLVP